MSIVEHFKQERENIVIINDISEYTNFLVMIPSQGDRRHFERLNTLKKVQILILGSFANLSFSNVCLVEHFNKKETTLLQSTISQNILICLRLFQF